MKRILITLFSCMLTFSEQAFSDTNEKESTPVALGQVQYYWLLNRSCYYGDDIGVRMLLDAGADVNGVDDYKKFVEAGFGIEPSWPINQASWNGHIEVVKLLLERGAKVDFEEGEGFTALLIATMRGHSDLVKILLEAGADRSYKGPEGTALEVARAKKFDEIVTLLTSKSEQGRSTQSGVAGSSK